MRIFKVTGTWKEKIFGNHGWWARFTTNVLNRPQWFKAKLPKGFRYYPMPYAPFLHDGWVKEMKETEAALDKLCNDRKS